MFQDPMPLGSPLFLGPGASAAKEFHSLPAGHGLASDIWTAGTLSAPHVNLWRSEVRRHLTETDSKGRPQQTNLFCVCLDAIEFGRILYGGETPKTGEPSYRELGSIALKEALLEFKALAKSHVSRVRSMDCVTESVNLSAALMGARFVRGAGPHSSAYSSDSREDYRFAVLRLSWVTSGAKITTHPVGGGQVGIINGLVTALRDSFQSLKARASTHFPPGYHLRIEEQRKFSPAEQSASGIRQEGLRDFYELSKIRLLPDCISAVREQFESVGAVLKKEPFDEDCVTVKPPESGSPTLLSNMKLEESDVAQLRAFLQEQKIKLLEIPDDLDAPTVSYLVETYSGVEAFMKLSKPNSPSTFTEHARALELSLRTATQQTAIGKRLDAEFLQTEDFRGKSAAFVTLKLTLPALSAHTKVERSSLLSAFGKLIASHKDFFVQLQS